MLRHRSRANLTETSSTRGSLCLRYQRGHADHVVVLYTYSNQHIINSAPRLPLLAISGHVSNCSLSGGSWCMGDILATLDDYDGMGNVCIVFSAAVIIGCFALCLVLFLALCLLCLLKHVLAKACHKVHLLILALLDCSIFLLCEGRTPVRSSFLASCLSVVAVVCSTRIRCCFCCLSYRVHAS